MAEKVTLEIDGNYSGLVQATDAANSQTESLQKSIEKLADSITDLGKDGKKSGKDLNDGLKDGEKGTKSLSGGFKAMGGAMKAAGIGLIIGLLASLKDVFMSNQKVMDGVNAVMETISITFNQVANIVMDVVESVSEGTNSFEGMQKVIGGLLKMSLTPLKLGFYLIKLGVQEAQLAWEESIFGNDDPETINKLNAAIIETKGALVEVTDEFIEAGKQVGENMGKAIDEVGQVVEKSVEGIKKVNIASNFNSAKTIVNLKKQAELSEAINQGLIEKYDLEIESLRQVRDEERNNLAVRKQANDEIKKKLEEQSELMKSNAQKAVDAAQAEYDKNDSQENYLALLQAQNEVLAVQAQVNGFMSEQKANDLALYREEVELTKAKKDGDLEAIAVVEDAKANAIENELERQAELDRLELERYEAKKLRLAEELQAMADAGQAETQAYIDKLNEQKLADADHQAYLIDSKKATAEYEKSIEEQKKNAIAGLGDELQQLLSVSGKKGAKAAKALAVAQTLFNTYESAVAAYKSTVGIPVVGPFLAPVKAAIATAFGLKSLNKLKSTPEPNLETGSVASSVSLPTATSGADVSSNVNRSPQINIVGQQTSNALLEGINNNTANPTRAYVVSKDITTTQELDRNKRENVSI